MEFPKKVLEIPQGLTHLCQEILFPITSHVGTWGINLSPKITRTSILLYFSRLKIIIIYHKNIHKLLNLSSKFWP